jgi:hypothetical protein
MFDIIGYKEKISNFFEIMVDNKDIADIKLSEDKWTLKDMVVHLIEEASISHQTYVRLQIDCRVKFPIYDPEIWKNITKINGFNFLDLINLWKYYNYFLLHLIQKIDEKDLDNIWERDGMDGMEFPLKYCIEDYFVRHMDWHIDLYKNRIEEINKEKSK